MSLYNQLFGVNPLAGPMLKVLDLKTEETGRFRDCYAGRSDDGEPRIFVFTRNGGGNRDDYLSVFENLAQHPEYVRDYDEDFDSTYATIEFRVPAEHRDMVLALLEVAEAKSPDAATAPMEKFQRLMAKLQGGGEKAPE